MPNDNERRLVVFYETSMTPFSSLTVSAVARTGHIFARFPRNGSFKVHSENKTCHSSVIFR